MNLHLPYDYLLEVRGDLLPPLGSGPNPNALQLNEVRDGIALKLDGDGPFGLRAILADDDQSPAASPFRWNVRRPSGLYYAASLLQNQPSNNSPHTLNPEWFYAPNDQIVMAAAAGNVSAGGFTFVYRGVKYLAPQPAPRPPATEMEFGYYEEFTMSNGGVTIPQFTRRSVQLDPDADFLLQYLTYQVDVPVGQLRIRIYSPEQRALSNDYIPIEVAAGEWGANYPRAFAPDVLYPADGQIVFEMFNWSPAEADPTVTVQLNFSGCKRYKK